jgi:hypothetical protein
MVELTNKTDNTIPVRELKDGQIAVITEWCNDNHEYDGQIVQRWNDNLIHIGEGSGESWTSLPNSDECRVRVLADGETLVIKNNQ